MATVLWGWHTNGSFAVVTAAAAYCHLAQSLDSILRKASDIIKKCSISTGNDRKPFCFIWSSHCLKLFINLLKFNLSWNACMRLDKCLKKPVQTKKKNTKKLSSSPAMKKQSEVHRCFATGLRKQTIELKYFWHFYGLLQKRLWHFVTKEVSQPCKTFSCMERIQDHYGGSNHL